LVEETNNSRLVDNIPAVQFNPLLSVAAQLKAEDMAQKSYFAHTSPEGVTPWYWLDEVGYKYSYAGENLAVNFSDSKDVVDAWMNSPGHRQNILNSHFTEIGIGAAEGIYQNKKTVFVVQFFGSPLEKEIPAVAVASVPTAAGAQEISQLSESEQASEVLSAETMAGSTAFIQETISSPRARTQHFYFALILIIAAVLILNIFAKIKIQHKELVINGVALILIINIVLFINNYFFSANGAIGAGF
jgi:hypothetical protein